jgi:hypothetical protein
VQGTCQIPPTYCDIVVGGEETHGAKTFPLQQECGRKTDGAIGLAGKTITFKTTLKGVGARLQQSAVGDLWMPILSFIALLVTLVIGLERLVRGPTVITTLAISVVWIVYAIIPSLLLLHYTFIGRGTTLVYMCR